MGTFLFYLPTTLQKRKGTQWKASAWGLHVPWDCRRQGPWTIASSPSLSQAQNPFQHDAIWTWSYKWVVHGMPWGHRVHLPPSLISLPPPKPQDSDSDLYSWKLMGQSGYNFFSI